MGALFGISDFCLSSEGKKYTGKVSLRLFLEHSPEKILESSAYSLSVSRPLLLYSCEPK